MILYPLPEGTLPFDAIRRRLTDVTQRMLTNQLRAMEADGQITRMVYAQVPPKVEYSLTEHGRSLEPVMRALMTWGDLHTAQADTDQNAA